MHRGSSKGAREHRAPETLPLSAPPAPRPIVAITLEVARAHRSDRRVVEMSPTASVRDLLRQLGLSAEGCAVLEGERPLPSDEVLGRPRELTIVPTFSGG